MMNKIPRMEKIGCKSFRVIGSKMSGVGRVEISSEDGTGKIVINGNLEKLITIFEGILKELKAMKKADSFAETDKDAAIELLSRLIEGVSRADKFEKMKLDVQYESREVPTYHAWVEHQPTGWANVKVELRYRIPDKPQPSSNS